jgi:hypothetical protein
LPSSLPFSMPNDPGFRTVAERWDKLPEAIRAGILALVNAAGVEP